MRPAERAVLVSIVLIVAAAARVAFVVGADVPRALCVDSAEYAQYAHNLVEHGVYSMSKDPAPLPDSFRSPGFPLFLACCRLVGGESGWFDLARWLQVVLSTLTVLFSFRLARQFVSFAPAVLGSVFVALSPHVVVTTGFVLTECLAAFVVTCGLWLLVGSRSKKRDVVGALVLGFAPLCNETMVFLPLVAGFVLWRQDRRRAITVFALAMLPFVLWNVRNQTTELARRGSERATASISHGSYPGMVYEDEKLFGFPYREDPAQPEFGSSWCNLAKVLWPRVQAEPLRYLKWYAFDKPVWLWSWPLVQGRDIYVYPLSKSPYDRQAVMKASYALMHWLHVPVMLLALLGAGYGILRGRREQSWAPQALGWIAVLGTLAYLPVIPDPRYLQPIRPVLFVLAGAAVPMIVAWLRGRATPAPLAATVE
ncbi:MAG: hypothetical protein ACJA0V_001237 [Planctomycetota bacterium]